MSNFSTPHRSLLLRLWTLLTTHQSTRNSQFDEEENVPWIENDRVVDFPTTLSGWWGWVQRKMGRVGLKKSPGWKCRRRSSCSCFLWKDGHGGSRKMLGVGLSTRASMVMVTVFGLNRALSAMQYLKENKCFEFISLKAATSFNSCVQSHNEKCSLFEQCLLCVV